MFVYFGVSQINGNFTIEVLSMRELKPKFTDKELGNNPFAQQINIPTRSFTGKEYFTDEDGDKFPTEIVMDAGVCTKIYISAENRIIVNNLSDKARALFLWIAFELETGKDFVWINRTRYMSELNISSTTTVSNAINELVRYGFISHTPVKGVFWINPGFLFNGSRIKKYIKKDILSFKNAKEVPQWNK